MKVVVIDMTVVAANLNRVVDEFVFFYYSTLAGLLVCRAEMAEAMKIAGSTVVIDLKEFSQPLQVLGLNK